MLFFFVMGISNCINNIHTHISKKVTDAVLNRNNNIVTYTNIFVLFLYTAFTKNKDGAINIAAKCGSSIKPEDR